MLNNRDRAKVTELAKEVETVNVINKELYDQYNIMHGLRYRNGTGVLVGLTRIGEVKGYDIVDGEKIPSKGELRYRGYNVFDFVRDIQSTNRFGYEEVTFLLLFGKLPTPKELRYFQELLIEARELPHQYLEDVILKIPSKNIMNKMMCAVLTLYSYDEDPENVDTENVLRQSISLLAKIPMIMAYSYQAKAHYLDGDSLIIHGPDPLHSTAETILHLSRKDSEFTDQEAKLLDLLLVLHAEHGGGNNSAFATHVVTSSGTDTYSAISTAMGSLKGPRHGGANKKVSEMLSYISRNIRSLDNEEDIENILVQIIKGEGFDEKGLIYGMGHAVYTMEDPRSTMLKEEAKKLAAVTGFEDKFEFLQIIERLAGSLLQEKKGLDYPVCSNVDLYAGLVYEMLGVPQELYTPLFAVSRMAGWCAHRLEQIQDPKIIRPAYVTLDANKKYVAMDDRQ